MAELTPQGSEARVYIGVPNKLRYTDQTALCSLACMCQHAPNISRSGQNLKQNCMARNLDTVNRMRPSQAIYKPEVSYDMTQNPPAPILESNPPAGQEPQKHGSWLGWLSKYWDDPEMGRPPYKRGTQQIRRPDIIIVNDPLKSPVQSNIYQVVEVKFPGDALREDQEDDYKEIAGSSDRFVLLTVQSDCGCDDRQNDYEQERAVVRQQAEKPVSITNNAEVQELSLGSYSSRSTSRDSDYNEATNAAISTGFLAALLSLLALDAATP